MRLCCTGKNATAGFNSRIHSDDAKKWMKDFEIGTLGDSSKKWLVSVRLSVCLSLSLSLSLCLFVCPSVCLSVYVWMYGVASAMRMSFSVNT